MANDEKYLARRKERNAALHASFLAATPQAAGGGAQLDAEVASLNTRVASLDTSLTALTARVTALEAGEPAPEPVPPDPEPPSGKRYPTKNDPMTGVPAGTNLQTQGATTLSQNGAKISGKKFTGRVTVTGDDVEIFNCEINTSDWWGVEAANSARLNIHHCLITSASTSGNSGINTGNGTHIHHNRFVGWENVVNVGGDDVLIEWNEAWQLKGNSSSHYDNIQADGGFRNLIIRNNYLDCGYNQTSACMLDNYFGAIDNILVENNFLGGGGFPAYLDGSFKGSSNATNVRYLNNDMRKGGWGYFYHDSAHTPYTRTGNKDYLTGVNVDEK